MDTRSDRDRHIGRLRSELNRLDEKIGYLLSGKYLSEYKKEQLNALDARIADIEDELNALPTTAKYV